MKQKTVRLTGALVLLGSLLVWIPPARSQQRDLPLDRILNLLPEFDPFEKPAPPPQFFPDEVDKQAREALVDALTNRKESLEDHLKFLRAEDERQQKQHGSVTGLTDHLQDLVNNTIQDRERYLAAQKEAVKNSSSPERKKYLEAIINNDDLNRADRLMRQSAVNTWGGVLNRMLSSVDLVSVASGNYIGAAVDTAVTQLYALADRDMPAEQRRALARDLDHLKRYPDDPRNAEILKRVETLDKDKKGALVKKHLAKADEAFGKGEYEKARFYIELASFLEPESRDVEKARQQVTKVLEEQEQARKSGLAATQEQTKPPEQQEDIQALLQALSLRDANQIERLAVDIDRKYHGKPLSDSARDAEAVALEMKGWHEEAKNAVAQVARSSVSTEIKKRADALLQSPEYNLLAQFRDAQSDRRLQSAKYVLLGEDLLKKNLIYAASLMAASGPSGAATLGALNALMMGQNLYRVLTDNPISAQPVIDAGVAYVRNHPNSSNATEVYRVLADAYEEKGLFDKAISYHQLAGTPKEKIAAIKEKAAKAYLNAAGKSTDRGAREYYLTTVVDEYPESPAAAEATKKLAELAKDENRGLRMSKQFLTENPELYGPAGLNLKPSLFDGNLTNMELADRGVNLISDDEIIVSYQTPWGVRSQSYPFTKQMSERFFTTLRQKNHDVAMATVDQRARDTVGGIKNLPASIVTGGERKSEKPKEHDDSTFSLVREAGGPASSFPKVLDYQLLSENERNPGAKYALPPIQGSISANRFTMIGGLPAGLWGSQLAVGTDQKGGYAGMQLPIPLLQGFIPVDFMVQGRPGGVAVYPKIHTAEDKNEDPELYR